MKSGLFRIALTAVLLAAVVIVMKPAAAKAIAYSPGCAALRGGTYPVPQASLPPGTDTGTYMEFWKGEIIVARIVSGTGVFALEDNPMSVVAGPGAGPLSYTIPFSGVQGVGWANLGTTTISLSVGCISGQYEAVPIPDGFKLYSISCDTAVYDRPGGSPVGGNMVTAGQTWFVDPMPVAGPDGQNWTEIFVAGPITGYIPNACVGDPQ